MLLKQTTSYWQRKPSLFDKRIQLLYYCSRSNRYTMDRLQESTTMVDKEDTTHGMGAVRLLREIGLLHASTIMTGIIIGSGIFVSPTSITYHSGSVGLSLFLWAASGILVTLVALCYTELGCIYAAAGGEYLYTKKVLGDLAGFLVSYVHTVIVQPAFYALLAMTASNYILYSLYKSCMVPEISNKLLSVWIVGKLYLQINIIYVFNLETIGLSKISKYVHCTLQRPSINYNRSFWNENSFLQLSVLLGPILVLFNRQGIFTIHVR